MVDTDEVRRVAENARLDITEEEVEEFAGEFEEILEMFSKLNEVDTSDTEPAFHPVEIEPETREDEREETLSREEVFQNTDNVEEDQFKGPKV
ncbi:MAG: Asp-tRNA(Asn)/Glu-tRNA(Gln) amidotransferase subunit GatC [Candidatus Nanohaloarchaea archaeon]